MTRALPTGRPAKPAEVRPIQLRPAPRREPPFDDEVDPATVAAGPLDRPLPFPAARRHLALAAPATTRHAELPDPAAWVRRLLLGIIEAAAGRRPITQLAPLVSPGVAQGLRSDLITTSGSRHHWIARASVRSVRASEPAATVAELAATVALGSRVRAIAFRLEVRHGRWCCTRLVMG